MYITLINRSSPVNIDIACHIATQCTLLAEVCPYQPSPPVVVIILVVILVYSNNDYNNGNNKNNNSNNDNNNIYFYIEWSIQHD